MRGLSNSLTREPACVPTIHWVGRCIKGHMEWESGIASLHGMLRWSRRVAAAAAVAETATRGRGMAAVTPAVNDSAAVMQVVVVVGWDREDGLRSRRCNRSYRHPVASHRVHRQYHSSSRRTTPRKRP